MSVSPGSRIFAIGDSHVIPLGGRRGVFRKHLGPVTLNRFGRPGEAHRLFRSLQHIWPSKMEVLGSTHLPTLVLSFGEIDLRAHVLRQAQARKISTFEVINLLVDSALNGIVELRQVTNARIIFLAPTPPTDIVSNPEFPASGLLSERIAWSQFFSSRIRDQLSERTIPDVKFLDVSKIFGTSDGVLAEHHSDGNVHYGKHVGSYIVNQVRILNEVI